MKTILQVNSSIHSDDAQSSQLAGRIARQLQAQHGGAEIVVRDLAREPLLHLDAERFGAFIAKPEARTPAQQAAVAQSDALIEEVRRADAIVLAVPMYNFGVPSQLKAWIDHIARAGVTFRYTEQGPIGLLTGKKAYVVSTRGGRYVGTDRDTETPYLRHILAFIGIEDVEFVFAEGLAMGEAPRNEGLAQAREAIGRMFGDALAA